jgi:hypothetical protein
LLNNHHLALTLVFSTSLALACGSSGKPKDSGPGDAPSDGGADVGADMSPAETSAPADTTPPVDTPPSGEGDVVIPETGDLRGDVGFATTKVSQFASALRPCGLAYADATSTVWVFPCSSPMAHAFTPAGMAMGTLPLQGESSDDGDVDIAPRAFMLGTTPVPAGALLYTNGEMATAEIYAYDVTSKMPLGMLATMYGDSHVVGASFHATRGTFFAVQDRQSSAGNRIAEIDVGTGAASTIFPTTPNFVVNYGDVEVCQTTGNLLVVSSDRTDIGEFTPGGAFVSYHDLPADVTLLSGIGVDDATGELWVAGTGGTVWRLSNSPCPARGP